MAERSFAREVEALKLGDGEIFRGEGIFAVTKALLQSGVAYVGGYQGAPVSHLIDVLTDAEGLLHELGVHFEASASEATAAAMLSASINYPLRGAVTWKSTVGTNVASDALANLASSGVKGGALIILGEDYGEGASIMQERTHAFAMKSQMWLLDPRPQLPAITRDIGIVLQGGLYNNTLRAMELLGCADTFGNSNIPLYVLNATYPLVPEEWVKFCSGKRAVLVVEEGQPEFIEQAASQILHKH